MKTIIQEIKNDSEKLKKIQFAAEIIRNGGLVAFPTETVYGLGGNGLDCNAAEKIYAAKGRPSDNPLILHIANIEMLKELVTDIPVNAYKIADKFWPGPLTMIFKRKECVPDETTGGLDTVAIRMPSHSIALELIKEANVPIAAPSANTSGRPSPTTASHVKDDLDGKIDCIIDGGEVGIGIESTIVDMTENTPTILRPGFITKEMLEEVVGEVLVDKAILKENIKKNMVPKAPGMKYKHYAPKGQLLIVQGEISCVIETINKMAKDKEEQGFRVGIVATEETMEQYREGTVYCIGSRKDEASIAKGLYSVLRKFDEIGAQYIFTESFVDNKYGQAIMNRLLKAAGYQCLEV